MSLQQTSANKFNTTKWIVDNSVNGISNGATHSSITDALASASAFDTIHVKPGTGTYTENPTLKEDVAVIGDATLAGLGTTILGKITASASGSMYLSNLTLKTNGDYAIEDTGSNSGNLFVENCSLNFDSTGGINLDNVNRSLQFGNCNANRNANSIKLFNVTACASLVFRKCAMSGQSFTPVASTIAAGSVSFDYCRVGPNPIIASSTGTVNCIWSRWFLNAYNVASITTSGSGTCSIQGFSSANGTAPAIDIGSGTTVTLDNAQIFSTNANPLTGLGTIRYGLVDFLASGNGIDVTTQQVSKSYVMDLAIRTAPAYSVLCGPTAIGGKIQTIASNGTSGMVLTSTGTTSLPTMQSPSGGGGLTWNEVSGTTQAMAVDNGYWANNGALVTMTLPTTSAINSVIRVAGKSATGWKIAQNASQQIHWLGLSTTVGVTGSLDSTNQYDAVELLCTVADLEWVVISNEGNIDPL